MDDAAQVTAIARLPPGTPSRRRLAAQLHPRIVGGQAGAVYSPAVLRLPGHVSSEWAAGSLTPPWRRDKPSLTTWPIRSHSLQLAALHEALQAGEIPP